MNENPVVQIGLVGLLAVAIAFLFMTRVLGQDDAASEPAADGTTTTIPGTSASLDSPEGQEIAEGIADAAGAPGAVDPATGAPAAVSGFEAGPGLPAPVVKAYADGKPVVVLITRRAGIEDRRLRALVGSARSVGGSTVFTTNARHIARYSRITRGVDVSRVPALVVVRPRKLTEGPVPEATVSYGFRGPESVKQAVRDALYKGRDDLPYYPE